MRATDRLRVFGPLLSALAALASVAPSRADVTAIALPGTASASARADLARLRGHALTLASEPVFDAGERRALEAMGERAMAAAIKITVKGAEAVAALSEWARAEAPGLRIEANPSALAMSDAASMPPEEPLERLQWGNFNRGIPQRLDIDDLTSIRVPGRPGEDAGLRAAPPEPLVAVGAARRVIVAVLDTGIDYAHPDLQGQIVRKDDECRALEKHEECMKTGSSEKCAELSKIDSDGNGYPLDCSGWNVTKGRSAQTGVYGGPDASDDAGHGTHVSGIIGAALNGAGIRGVARNVAILPVKVIASSPNAPIRPQSVPDAPPGTGPLPSPIERDLRWSTGFGDVIARGMLYALRSGAQVINLSLAWPAGVDSALMRRMTALAQARGALVVAAAGNDSADSRVFPCLYAGVVCVASHNPDGALSHFSNHGAFVDVAAPGLGILSTWPLAKRSGNFTAHYGYELKNGTSMAAPYVVGILARLIASGMPATEAYARLLVGARPHARAVGLGMDAANRKYTRSGNADLAASFRAPPLPLLLPAEKASLSLAWDRRPRELPFAFTLRNFWAAASASTIRAEVLTQDGSTATGARLATARWDTGAWADGATRRFEGALRLESDDVEGRLRLELSIDTPENAALGQAPRAVRIPIEISVPVGRELRDPSVRRLEIRPGATNEPPNGTPLTLGDPRKWSDLRSVSALDGKPGHDYVAIEEGPETTLRLVREIPGSHYEVSAVAKSPAIVGALMLIQRIDADQDGASDFVFIYRMPPPEGADKPIFRFQYYDSSLKPLRSVSETGAVDFDNVAAAITERFQWMPIEHQGKPLLAPAWIALGTTPALDKPGFDPWEPKPTDPPRSRLYYLIPAGLRALKAPEKQSFIQLLAPPASRGAGPLDVILARGDDYDLEYSLGTLNGGRLSTQAPLGMERFRMLAGIENVVAVTPLNGRQAWSGTAFSEAATRGHLRTTALLLPGAPGAAAGPSLDFTQAPASELDSVMQLSGLFVGDRRRAAFVQTHYELQYNDLVTGQTARTGLDRFSFLPSFIFGRGFFPVVVDDAGADRSPGILIPSSLGVSDSTEVVVPRYASDGSLLGLARPARFRLATGPGCVDLGNPVSDGPGAPTQLVFFCGDAFFRVALSM